MRRLLLVTLAVVAIWLLELEANPLTAWHHRREYRGQLRSQISAAGQLLPLVAGYTATQVKSISVADTMSIATDNTWIGNVVLRDWWRLSPTDRKPRHRRRHRVRTPSPRDRSTSRCSWAGTRRSRDLGDWRNAVAPL